MDLIATYNKLHQKPDENFVIRTLGVPIYILPIRSNNFLRLGIIMVNKPLGAFIHIFININVYTK